jgi:hypothetical protein
MGRILVCGGRHYDNVPYLCGFLDCYHATISITLLVHGGASGADFLAEAWAKMHRVPWTEYKADWEKHGKAAGPIRNRFMFDDSLVNVVIAFPGGKGTADMVTYARSKHAQIIRAGE